MAYKLRVKRDGREEPTGEQLCKVHRYVFISDRWNVAVISVRIRIFLRYSPQLLYCDCFANFDLLSHRCFTVTLRLQRCITENILIFIYYRKISEYYHNK